MVAIGIIAGGICATLLALSIYDAGQNYLQAILVKARALELLSNESRSVASTARLVFADLCRNGIVPIRVITQWLLHLGAVTKQIDMMVVYLADCGFAAKREAVLQIAVVASAILLILGLVLFGDLLVAAVLCIAVLFFSWNRASVSIKKNQAANNEQLPDVIHTIGLCFSSGLSLEQAMTHTSQEVSGQMSKLLSDCANDMQAGRSVDEALACLEQRCELSDIRFMAVALDIQHTTGGGLKELLDHAAQAIRTDLELKRSLKVQTAQARLSARIVTLLPLALVALLSVAMDGYLASFFSSIEGFTILIIAVVLELSGVLVVRRILANGAGL